MKTTAADPRLLHAPVPALVLQLALPGMIGMIASSAGALADAMLLGRRSAQLLAAVSLSFPLLTLIQTLGFTLGMGAGAFVSRSLGCGDRRSAYTVASTAFFSALMLSLALCIPGALLSAPLCALLGADDALRAPAAVYARYVLLSGPLLCMSLVLSSLLRAQGKTLPNMLAFVLGAAVGTALEAVLVLLLRWDLHGAGTAMLVREGVTLLVLAAATGKGKRLIRPRVRTLSLRLNVFRKILRSGLPTLLRQGFMSASSVMLSRALAAFGEAAISGVGLTVRVVSLISAAVIGFGQGFQPVCGVNLGAGKPARILAAYRFCMRCVCVALALLGAALFAFAPALLGLFTGDAQSLSIAAAALRAQSVTLWAQGAVIMMNMLTQALGLSVRASLIATSRQGFVFIPLLWLLTRIWGLQGLILCQSVSDAVSLVLCALLTRPVIRGFSCGHAGCSDARKASQ